MRPSLPFCTRPKLLWLLSPILVVHCFHMRNAGHGYLLHNPSSLVSNVPIRQSTLNNQEHPKYSATRSVIIKGILHSRNTHLLAENNDSKNDENPTEEGVSPDNGSTNDEDALQTNPITTTTTTLGVQEKGVVLRELVNANDDVDTCVPAEDLVDPTEADLLLVDYVCATDEEDGDSTATSTVTTNLDPKTIFKFVLPTLALWTAPPVMSLIDTSVVGRYCGARQLAALSPGCTLIDSSAFLMMFIATAAINLVAATKAKTATTSSSSGDIDSSNNNNNDSALRQQQQQQQQQVIISEALWLACGAGMGLASMVWLAGFPLLSLIAGQASASVVPSALQYATIRAWAQPLVVMASVARASLLAQQDTKGPLISVAIAFCINVVGTLGLVKYTNLGIRGAAIGTVCADVCATAFLLRRIRQSQKHSHNANTDDNKNPNNCNNKLPPLLSIPTKENFKIFCQYAAPIFFTILGKSVVYNGVAISVGRLGSVALAAHQVLLRSFFFWTPVGDSVGMTSQVFLPAILQQEQASGQAQTGAKRLLFLVGVVAGLIAATLAGLLPSQGAALFTRDAAVAAALRRTAPILALSVAMHATALTCEGMLLALRDLRFLSNSYVITTVATMTLLLSPLRPASLSGSWWILAMFQGGRVLQFTMRLLQLSTRKRTQQQRQ